MKTLILLGLFCLNFLSSSTVLADGQLISRWELTCKDKGKIVSLVLSAPHNGNYTRYAIGENEAAESTSITTEDDSGAGQYVTIVLGDKSLEKLGPCFEAGL